VFPHYAHSSPENSPLPENSKDDWHFLKDHLTAVGKGAEERASFWGGQDEAKLAGLLHDMGKYAANFQKRLEGKMRGVNHWSQGAFWAGKNEAWLAAFAIYGHHVGIPPAEMIQKLGQSLQDEMATWNIAETVQDIKAIFEHDGLAIPQIQRRAKATPKEKHRFAMAVRMLFSALCDADFIDTEAHFNKYASESARPTPPQLQPRKALDVLLNHIQAKPKPADTNGKLVYETRQRVLQDCLNAAQESEHLFTLTAPTGSGKTLASLAFALKHAATYSLRRVIVVIPYLSIIEQTAGGFREIFEPVFGPQYLLEHHSMADRTRNGAAEDSNEEKDAEWENERRRRLLSQNWEAPLIVTTSVQFFESLFANRPTTCRKLHNIAKSVVYFDEAQTLPTGLAVSTLGALNVLMKDYGVTVVFGTATQPAFKSLSDHIPDGWQPREIIQNTKGIFNRLKRVAPVWPSSRTEKMEWSEVARELVRHNQALCVVNLKKHTAELTQAMLESLPKELHDSLFHLSTALCPAHRQVVLKKVRALLDEGQKVYLVATQCIEAGVDVDFPVVWRAMGPLESLAQAFGRCNREGRLQMEECEARVFVPADDDIPMPGYKQAASIAATHYWKADLHSPEVFDSYFSKLYGDQDIGGEGSRLQRELRESIEQLRFPDIAQPYRLISSDTVSVVVPYTEQGAKACKALQSKGLNIKALRALMFQAQPYVVNVYRNQLFRDRDIASRVIPVLGDRKGGWYIWIGKYDDRFGILTKMSDEAWIV
jgi:CRISPR-associated helicase Cas3/CRISPR-associated endonuclease Cas3-HD